MAFPVDDTGNSVVPPLTLQWLGYGVSTLWLALLLGGFLLAFGLGEMDGERRQAEARNQALAELATVRARLEGTVFATFNISEGMVHLIQHDGDINGGRFAGMAAQAMASVPHIRNITLAPDDVIRSIYPLEGNQAAIGVDFRSRPDQYVTIQQSRESRKPILAGPVKLIQGGRGLIHRSPVFVAVPGGTAGERRYWGTVSVVADVDRLLASAGLVQTSNYLFALRGQDAKGERGELIWGEAGLATLGPVALPVQVPGGTWELATLPREGWPRLQPWQSPWFWGTLAGTLVLALLGCGLAVQHLRLRSQHQSLFREMRERQQVAEAYQDSQALLHAIVDNAPALIYVFDTEGRLQLCNRLFEKVVGCERGAMLGKPREEFLPRVVAEDHRRNDLEVIRRRETLRFDELNLDGAAYRAYLSTKCPLLGQDGGVRSVIGISTDITDIRDASEQLRLAGVVLDSTADGVVITDEYALIVSVNKAFTAITGFAAAEALGKNPSILRSEHQGPEFYQAMWASLKSTGFWRGEIWNRRKSGELFPEWLTINAVYGEEGQVTNYVGVFSDISAIKHSQMELERLAHFDPLTGLPNRVLLHDRLRHALERAQRYQHELAVLILDLDGFKTVNDSLGHPVGDLLLQHAADRLRCSVRVEDTVARLGGDEFAVIVDHLGQGGDVINVVRKILAALQQPFDLEPHTALVTASIGIAVAPADGCTPEELVRNADTAMYGAKEGGRNNYRFYQADMTRRAQERLSQEKALRLALERDELEVWYQPKLDLQSGRVTGAEALMRWHSPERGLVPPAEFIPTAERSGLIVPLGLVLLDKVCRQSRAWRDAGVFSGRVAINVATLQIERSDFTASLRQALADHGLEPAAIEVEVTESLIMENPENARQVLDAIQGMGITTAVDDFGTGYSSLAYLKLLPIDHLKIDRAFVSDTPADANDVAIVRAVIALGHSLGYRIIAEGIETEAQLRFLQAEGCDEGQGYLFARPLPAAEFEAWLASFPDRWTGLAGT